MNSNRSRNSVNNSANPTCFGQPRECVVQSFVLTVSTLIFVTSMILTVYLTHKATMDKIVVGLIVESCLLYILGFTSNMYHIYYSKPKVVPSRSALNQDTWISAQNSSSSGRPRHILGFSHARQPLSGTPPPPYEIPMSEMSRILLPGTSQTTDSSTGQSEITEETRILIKSIYEEIRKADQQVLQSPKNERSVQQMVRTPQTPVRQHKRMCPREPHSNLVHLQETAVKSASVRELTSSDFRTNQATKHKGSQNSLLTQRDLQRTTTAPPQLSPRIQETAVKSVPVRGIPPFDFLANQATEHKASQNSLPTQHDLQRLTTVNERRTAAPLQTSSRNQVAAVKSLPIRGFTPSDFSANQANEHKTSQNLLRTQLDSQRLIIGSGGCTDSPSQPSPRIQETGVKCVPVHGITSSDFRTNQATEHKAPHNSLQTQRDFQRSIIGGEGFSATSPEPPPRKGDFFQIARNRKLTSLSNESQTRPKTRGYTSHGVVDENDPLNNAREPIVRSFSSTSSSQVTYDSADYYCIESEFEDSSERASSVCSAASEPGAVDRKRKFQNSRVRVCRQLSAPTSRQFRQLGQSPEAFLDALATCLDLTPDEWRVAWELGKKGVSPIERARILGVRLNENSSSEDN